jgi:hypothetical protein
MRWRRRRFKRMRKHARRVQCAMREVLARMAKGLDTSVVDPALQQALRECIPNPPTREQLEEALKGAALG